MTISHGEFQKSLGSLAPGTPPPEPGEAVRLPLGSGAVVIGFAALPGMRLGGLLELPRAQVTLTFEAVPAPERDAFLRRFDVAFQRGGG